MNEKRHSGTPVWVDPDDAPELTDQYFAPADVYAGERLIRRGRRKLDAPKQLVSLRLDADVLQRLRALGPGWQTRVNEQLRMWMDRAETP